MRVTEADESKAYAAACDAIQDRVRKRIGRKCLVAFSAFRLDAKKMPVDNLDEVPIEGKVLVRSSRKGGFQRRDAFESPIMESPTWLELCAAANDLLTATRRRSLRFLEGIEVVEKIDDIQIVDLTLRA